MTNAGYFRGDIRTRRHGKVRGQFGLFHDRDEGLIGGFGVGQLALERRGGGVLHDIIRHSPRFVFLESGAERGGGRARDGVGRGRYVDVYGCRSEGMRSLHGELRRGSWK